MLITGGSGGIGSACARALAAEGARLVVHYNRGEERARALSGELGGTQIARADLTVEAEVERLFDEVRATLGSIDTTDPPAGEVGVSSRGGNANAVRVITRDSGGTAADRPFHLTVNC